MEIIAKTNDGVMILATENEAKEIIRSVSGETPEKLKIGQKIPAIDYAASIKKVKELKDSYSYQQIISQVAHFNAELTELNNKLIAANNSI